MTDYSVGFMFYGPNVVLIRKVKPEWQAGLLNGVGGHVEEGETPHDAMCREFHEETGVAHADWDHYATIKGPWGSVACFRSFVKRRLPVRTTTEEEVRWFPVQYLNTLAHTRTVPNLSWLIPLALYENDRYASVTVLTDQEHA